jgi:5-methylcytosine-specific restriction enzyme A
VRIFGDHIIELKDGGAPLDPSNIMLLCPTCHARKTAKAAQERLQG